MNTYDLSNLLRCGGKLFDVTMQLQGLDDISKGNDNNGKK